MGAHLLNGLTGPAWSVTYWRAADDEVDYVVSHGAQDWAVEVKSGRPGRCGGLAAFRQRYPEAGAWLVGPTGIPLEEFFARPAMGWFH